MAKSKSKKRHANSNAAVKDRARANALADEKDRNKNRMNPIARNLMLGDLVFLAIVSMLDTNGMITDLISNLCTIIGIVLLCIALYVQFGKGSGTSSKPRLR